jgi:hypothetical protein
LNRPYYTIKKDILHTKIQMDENANKSQPVRQAIWVKNCGHRDFAGHFVALRGEKAGGLSDKSDIFLKNPLTAEPSGDHLSPGRAANCGQTFPGTGDTEDSRWAYPRSL